MSLRPGRLPPTKEASKGSNEPKGKSPNKYEFSQSFDKVTKFSLDTLVSAQTTKTMIAGPDFFHIGNSSIFDNISRSGVTISSSVKAFFSPSQPMKLQFRALSRFLTFLLTYWVCSIGVSANTKQPNVVIIFTDDMGYGDIGPFGSNHPTPHLDRMAKEGMKLTDFYVSSTACTPSRSALLTGCYADRIGMGKSVVFPSDKRGLNPTEITIAEILKKGGYATGCFGKWHLGDQPTFMPLAQGFDEYQGIPYSNDMWVPGNPKRNYPPLPWIVGNQPVAHIPDASSQAVITDSITDAAVDFIERYKEEPFFCYVPHSAVHAPFMVTPERLESADQNVMRALVGEIDSSTGRILDCIRKNGIENNTLVLFTNDNGGAGKTNSGPLRGHKFGPKYEGHMRVPTLAWWPGKIKAGSVSSEIMATIDLLPTIASLSGQPMPKGRIIDGHDVSKILLGKAKAKSPHETLFYEKDGIRQGKWKLVRYKVKADRFAELYDLEKDLGEQNDLSKQYPQKVKVLTEILDAHVEKIEEGIRTAGLVESPKPLLTDSKGIPTLTEYRNL
jgi:arylsulfatase A-like enzyme